MYTKKRRHSLEDTRTQIIIYASLFLLALVSALIPTLF